MKNPMKLRRLPVCVLLMGLVCLALRLGLYAFGLDGRGLLVRWHPLGVGLWAAALLSALWILLRVWQLDGSVRYDHNFAPSALAAYGSFLMAAACAMTVLTHAPGVAGTLGLLWKGLGLLCGPLLVWAGICRLRGTVPFFLTYGGLCLFLLVHVMNQYQRWCGDPQLMDYVLSLLGVLALAFFAYYTAAFSIGRGSRRMQLGSGLLAVLLCTAAVSGEEFPFLYLGGAAFALTNLCFLLPRPREEGEYDPA